MHDPFNLDRFVRAQDPVIDQVQRELGAGQKRSHWMWFVFPQLAGLGRSAMARQYAIGSRAEAAAYGEHAILGPRLLAWTELVNRVSQQSARQIFGCPDDLKFHSSVTLFATVQPNEAAFQAALGRYFNGIPDAGTLKLLS